MADVTTAPRAEYKVIARIENVRVHVPSLYAEYFSKKDRKNVSSWRCGAFIEKPGLPPEIIPLGTGPEDIKFQLRSGKYTKLFFQNGQIISGVIVNKSYFGLNIESFDSFINATVIIKEKKVNNNKMFTELTIEETSGASTKMMQIREINMAGADTYEIYGATQRINFIDL